MTSGRWRRQGQLVIAPKHRTMAKSVQKGHADIESTHVPAKDGTATSRFARMVFAGADCDETLSLRRRCHSIGVFAPGYQWAHAASVVDSTTSGFQQRIQRRQQFFTLIAALAHGRAILLQAICAYLDRRGKLSSRSIMHHSRSANERIIEAIDKPLGFYVLALLIVELFLSTILILSDLDKGAKTSGMWAIIWLFVLVVVIVSVLAWFKPTNLTFTGHETLVSMGKATYGTNATEIKEEDLPSGTPKPE